MKHEKDGGRPKGRIEIAPQSIRVEISKAMAKPNKTGQTANPAPIAPIYWLLKDED